MYGIQKPSEYGAVDSFAYKQWFQRVYSYILSRVKLVTVTTTYSVQSDIFLVRADATGGGFTITLPTVASCTGRQIAVKKIDASANNVTVDGNGSETIDGAATKAWNTQYLTYIFMSNGVSWDIL